MPQVIAAVVDHRHQRGQLDESLPSTGMTTIIEARGLTKRHGDSSRSTTDLTIRRGERVAILGPNGAGKTTTIEPVSREATPRLAR
ncbi:MAG: ATP-binding cassette domain-containing protein [Actinomycetales bacterium]|nr:ATP-binding cassette domain-containing protein [Candidatus Lutibacillus vidarii]